MPFSGIHYNIITPHLSYLSLYQDEANMRAIHIDDFGGTRTKPKN